jgi:protein SCO1/2
MTSSAARTLLLATAAFVAALLGARALMPDVPAPPVLERAVWLPGGSPLPELAFVDETGAPFDARRLLGRWTYVFFGFASCPDICPTTLATLASVRRALRDLPAELQPAVLLVTVDPAQDDAARLASYVRHFDPAFHAVTGDEASLARLASALGAAYARVPLAAGGYTMDHSSSLFLIGPDGRLVATSGAPHDAEVIARDYRALVARGTASLTPQAAVGEGGSVDQGEFPF